MTLERIDILNKKKWQPKLDSLEGLPIRPTVKETRFYLDNEYYKKGYGAIFPHSVASVYNILAMHANHETQICWPSADTVMKLGGITNRSTVFEAFRILEAYDIVSIVRRSKGRVPNVYALLEPPAWKSVNSLDFETIRKVIKKKRTVSISQGQQLQNPTSNSSSIETRSHINKSDKEIRTENKKTDKETETIKGGETDTLEVEEFLNRLSGMSKSLLMGYFKEEDVIAALADIPGRDKIDDYKPVLTALQKRGAVPKKELLPWIRQ